MSNLTVTNPADPTQTYTFGCRGKRAKWLTEALAAGTIKVPEGYMSSADKAKTAKGDKPEKAVNASVADLNKRIEKLKKAKAHALNLYAVQVRHLEEARTEVDDIQAEIDQCNKAIEIFQPSIPAGAEIEPVSTDEAPVEPVTEAVTETAAV